jgi:hypothetical protein
LFWGGGLGVDRGAGGGKLLLLLGFGGHWRMWRGELDAYAAAGRRVRPEPMRFFAAAARGEGFVQVNGERILQAGEEDGGPGNASLG